MLESLITSKTRIKLLMKFFLNTKTTSYLRNLENEFGENSNAIRVELNRLEKAELLTSSHQGNKKLYHANDKHPMFKDIQNIVFKHTGIDKIVEKVVNNIGDLKQAWLMGDLAKGKNSHIIDLLFVGDDIDKEYIAQLCSKVEDMINRRIRYAVVPSKEAEVHLQEFPDALLLWKG